ncbi:MAG: RHS repeat-associated core domain-containing protein, partial [Spirulinaceae cyanobacterium]
LDMQYLRARYYDSQTGRFASVDPFEGFVEEPITRHRYVYGADNPVTYIDPSGKISTMADFAAYTALFNSVLASTQQSFSLGLYLVDRVSDEVTWTGSLATGEVSVQPLADAKVVSADINLGITVFRVAEAGEGYFADGTHGRLEDADGFILHTSASVSAGIDVPFPGLGETPLSRLSGSLTDFELKSHAFYGLDANVLFGGYVSVGYGAGPIVGRGKQWITMGFASGNAHGHFLANQVGGSLALTIGLVIPRFRGRRIITPE